MSTRDDNLKYLVEQVEDDVPVFFEQLTDDQLNDLSSFTRAVVAQHTAGLDRLFESAAAVVKLIPDFILQSMIPRYIDPPIAARISEKMNIKEVRSLAAGLSAEYAARTALYLNHRLAAEVLSGLSDRKAAAVLQLILSARPVIVLEMMEFLPEKTLKILRSLDLSVFRTMELHSPDHRATVDRLLSA